MLARLLLDPDSDMKRSYVGDRASLEFALQVSRKRREARSPEASIGAGTACGGSEFVISPRRMMVMS
jgi:hypothetical protein